MDRRVGGLVVDAGIGGADFDGGAVDAWRDNDGGEGRCEEGQEEDEEAGEWR